MKTKIYPLLGLSLIAGLSGCGSHSAGSSKTWSEHQGPAQKLSAESCWATGNGIGD